MEGRPARTQSTTSPRSRHLMHAATLNSEILLNISGGQSFWCSDVMVYNRWISWRTMQPHINVYRRIELRRHSYSRVIPYLAELELLLTALRFTCVFVLLVSHIAQTRSSRTR